MKFVGYNLRPSHHRRVSNSWLTNTVLYIMYSRVCNLTALQAGRSWIRFPVGSLGFFNDISPSGRTMLLGSTQPLTEMSTRGIFLEVKVSGAKG